MGSTERRRVLIAVVDCTFCGGQHTPEDMAGCIGDGDYDPVFICEFCQADPSRGWKDEALRVESERGDV